jgi:HSP20 family protein
MIYTNFPAPLALGRRLDLTRVFDDVLGRETPATWLPATDIREDATSVTLEMDLPGYTPEQVEVTTEDDMLTIRADKPAPQVNNEDTRWHLNERTHGGFKRAFRLPSEIEAAGIEATFTNGVLSVRLPKAPAAQPRRIQVTAKQA